MKNFGSRKIHLNIWVVLLSLILVAPAIAGVPFEVGLNRSSLLKLKKNVVLVTLANTKKEEKQKDTEIVVGADKTVAENAVRERRERKDSEQGNTNRFVVLEVLSPTLLKLDGINIGNTNMIVWEQGDGDKEPTAVFYDIRVTGDRTSIESQLKDIAPNDSINVQFANETVVLSGTVANELTRTKAENTAKAFGAKVINHITVDNPQQVLLEVKVAQVDKTSLKKLGISFMLKGSSGEVFTNMVGAPTGASTGNTISSGVGGTTTSQGSGTGISGNIAGLGSYSPLDSIQVGASYFKGGIGTILQALVTKGHAKVLSEPNLLVKSGQEGNFLAGSRIPYSVVANVGGLAATTIVYESVGIRLKFKPEVQENGMITLKIDPAEVSSIAGTMAVNGYPIIDTREVRTNVELKDGESLVLAGLLQEEQIKTMSKIPLLGDIPILGALFRSTQNDLKEKELVFFITPKIVKPLAKGVKQELPTDRKLTPEQERELKWMPLGE
jgi:pilus assembly protein CpaC